ncbi:serine hydrolase [Streptomyces sp. NRRL F-4474]|uniref:serine hydrolase n=1 Tax=Streptomyces sp. NRRL F-4474 TaxID=1463851 RepID=UPI0022771CE4|nr:serine hydrolase [Streptomyces sp. NRRL F-4474]
MTDGSSDDPKGEGTTVAGAEPEKAASASADATAEAESSRPAAASDGEPEATAEAAPETEADANGDAAHRPAPGAAAGAGAASGVEAEESQAEAPAEAGSGSGSESEDSRTQILRVPPATAPDDKPEPEAPTERTADEPATGTEDPRADTESKAAPKQTPEAGARSRSGSGSESEDSRTQILRVPPATAPDDKPEPEAPSSTTPDRKAEDKPEPDDSRTQVLRVPGSTTPDHKAEDKPEPESSGKKGAESAPKVPSWAAARQEKPESASESESAPDSESESEPRSGSESEPASRFVALKDLDSPPPVAARPRPTTQPHPRPEAAAPTAVPQPLPPLDLLAELTNPPAAPETPRRTVLRRVKVWTPILLLLVGACIGGQMLRPLPDSRLVAAETDHTVDGQLSIPWPAKGQGAVRVVGSGDIGTFGEQKAVPTASVAKIMTAYVVLKGHPLRKTEPGPEITVDAKAVADGNSGNESRITGLTVGSKFSQQDMLKMLMIPSGNNVARLLARWDTGTDSEAAFVEKMNAAARELGMKDTVYTDPSGLDAGTVSTATDQLKLAEAVMKDEAFRAIVALPEAPIKGLGEKLVNNNDLLTVQGLSIRGIKTGSSTPAGGTFVWAAYKSVGDETPLIVGSLMEQRAPAPDENALKSLELVKANSRKIIEAVRAALASTPLVRKGDVVGYVDDGLGGRTPLVAVKDLNVISVPGQRFKLSLKAGASPLPRTAKDGTEVGVLTAGEGEGAKSVPVAVKGALAEPSFGTRLTRLG